VKRVPLALHRALVDATRSDPGPPPSDQVPNGFGRAPALAAQPVLTYATVPNAERYRRLMRVLWIEHRHFGLRLRPEEIADRARELFALPLTPDEVTAHLEQLHEWDAVEREHDASLAATPREYRRSRFTYDITPAGRRVEELLAELDELRGRAGALDGSRLPALRDALRRLAEHLAHESPEPTAVRSTFEQVVGELEQLHSGALDFMRSLDRVVARGELVDDAEFERCKGALLEHLQGFRRDRQRHEEEIVEAIMRVDHLGVERLADLIVSAQDIPELPGAPAHGVAAERRAELRDKWAGVRSWFLGSGRAGSPWQVLGEKVVQAIRAILDIAEAIVDRRTGRADRAHACEHLARLAASGDAQAILVAALGIGHPRHVGAPEADAALVPGPGQTSWWDAPAAPVVAHLRRPGARTPGAGSSAPIADTSGARERAVARRRAEREELERALARFGGETPIRLAALGALREGEFRHLLAWIGRAFETGRDATGARHAWSSDGRARITLHAPTAERVTIVTPQGRFESPNYAVEVSAP
jgi:uncharacterized protein (TIGR02677 family)